MSRNLGIGKFAYLPTTSEKAAVSGSLSKWTMHGFPQAVHPDHGLADAGSGLSDPRPKPTTLTPEVDALIHHVPPR
ncbi:MAG: hypothetical protein UZ17_ACD001000549 [Acidobacteria bacterium OLB17]|nr:MAG: hypothetical protein UZ17_ACD001000549 [Acidobacteria bacterium OLB17]